MTRYSAVCQALHLGNLARFPRPSVKTSKDDLSSYVIPFCKIRDTCPLHSSSASSEVILKGHRKRPLSPIDPVSIPAKRTVQTPDDQSNTGLFQEQFFILTNGFFPDHFYDSLSITNNAAGKMYDDYYTFRSPSSHLNELILATSKLTIDDLSEKLHQIQDDVYMVYPFPKELENLIEEGREQMVRHTTS